MEMVTFQQKRSLHMFEPGAHCPYLGLKQNQAIRFASPTPEHRCYATGQAQEIPSSPPEYQSDFCLSANHVRCPLYTGRVLPSTPAPVAAPSIEPALASTGGLRGWLAGLPARDRIVYALLLALLGVILAIYSLAGISLIREGAFSGGPPPPAPPSTAGPEPGIVGPSPAATATGTATPTPTARPSSTPTASATPTASVLPTIEAITASPLPPTATFAPPIYIPPPPAPTSTPGPLIPITPEVPTATEVTPSLPTSPPGELPPETPGDAPPATPTLPPIETPAPPSPEAPTGAPTSPPPVEPTEGAPPSPARTPAP